MKIIYFTTLSIIIIASCSSSQKATIQKSGKELSDSLFFSFERTPCYGKCPVYLVSVYISGYATFDAKMNVPGKSGKYQTVFTKEELKLVSDKANEINFFNLEDSYDNPVTDLPTIITSVSLNGKKKAIRDRHHGPSELREFEKLADELFIGKEWSKIQESK